MIFLRALLGQGFKSVSIEDYRESIQKSDHVLVDVRSPGEYHRGHVSRAVNIPLGDLDSRLGEIPRDKPVVVICESGSRSRMGAATLAEHGVRDVHDLRGGTGLWASRGLPLKR